ncbi:hypothetical protein NL676_008068 [Syzygium grande]|nr:hypothetical protein NL676_008068 [Syzygium grande]
MELSTVMLAALFLSLGSVASVGFQVLLVMILGAVAVVDSLKSRMTTTESHSSSSLWMHDQALSTLRRREGTPKVQALGLTFDNGSNDCFTSIEFGPLSELRFLNLDRANMRGNFTGLLLELRWLHWRGCHKSSEPLILCPENLVILDLSSSAVADDWVGWTQIMEKANKLKVLDLTELKVLELVNDPDEEDIPSSELSQTESFGWISSLSNLETLKLCLPNVTSLPEDFNALTRLKTLELSCINLQDLPQLPLSLSKLLIKNCESQRVDFSNLETLSELELSDCNASEILGLGKLRLLQVLKISGCNINNLDGLEQASLLRRFSMFDCHSLNRLPDLSNCTSLEIEVIYSCNIQKNSSSCKDALYFLLEEVGVYFFLQDYSGIGLGREFGFEHSSGQRVS